MEAHNDDAAIQDVTTGVANLVIANGNESSASTAHGAVPHQIDGQLIPAGSGNSAAPHMVLIRARIGNQMTQFRLSKELAQLMAGTLEGCQVKPLRDDLLDWEALICGPKDTPYDGGIFKIILRFPEVYPFKPPRVRFLTKIYHINISVEGKVCRAAFNNTWTPAMKVSNVLHSLRQLLVQVIPHDPMDITIAHLYIGNRGLYDANAREWTIRYAQSQPQQT